VFGNLAVDCRPANDDPTLAWNTLVGAMMPRQYLLAVKSTWPSLFALALWTGVCGQPVTALLAVIATPAADAGAAAPSVAPPSNVKVPMTVASRADANPDATGRPSPVVLRVYQLKTDAVFSRSEFFARFDDEQKVLGSELISRDEFVLTPAENRNLEITLNDDTRFVGAIAAFRDIRNAQWRILAKTPLRGLTIIVERARLLLIPD
jgi:type VI secretion system protein VasD